MRITLACLLAATLLLGGVASANARGLTEKALRAYETATLGPEHAAEHAEQRREARRAERRWRRMSPREQAAYRRRLRRADVRATAALAAPLDEVGQWDPATIPLPTYAINAVLLPTGKIAFWGRPPLNPDGTRDNRSDFYVWDPATRGEPVKIDPPELTVQDSNGDPITVPAPIFCSGQSLLPDGELFVAGGNLANPRPGTDYAGLKATFTFDPWTLTWQRQPDMERGRWYPSQVELPDGRIAIFAGLDEDGQAWHNAEAELFTPAAVRGGMGTIQRKVAADIDTGLYPHVILAPDNRLVLGGPDAQDSGVFDLSILDGPFSYANWGSRPPLSTQRIGGNAFLWPQGTANDTRVTLLGGFVQQTGDATNTTETLDADHASDGWTVDGAGIPAMNVSRSYGNVVQLPDSSLVAVGGGAGNRDGAGGLNWTNGDERRKQVELLRPGVDSQWRLGPPQQKWRAYHSTALLLPDGRVLSAGDDYWYFDQARPGAPAPGESMDVGEIYSPPYLFDGDQLAARPVIDSAPDAVPYGAAFGVAVSGQPAGRAVLVAPGATTHGNDMNQRVIDLGTVEQLPGRGLNVRAPAGPNVAPPGYYMLFVLDADGTPSVAHWVRVAADAPMPTTLPPDATQTPTPTPTPGPTVTPTPTPSPTATPTPPPKKTTLRVRVRLTRHGRHLRLRVTLDAAGRATLDARITRRRVRHVRHVRRTLVFAHASTRTVRLTAPRGATRLTVSVRARDTRGHRSSISRHWRL